MCPLQAPSKGFGLQIWEKGMAPWPHVWFMSSTTRFPGPRQERALDLARWNEDQLMNSHGTLCRVSWDLGAAELCNPRSRPDWGREAVPRGRSQGFV